MPRGVGYESLAALVDYLTKEEEDRQVSLSALANAARQGIGQGVVDPVVDFVGAGQLGAEAPTDQPAQGFGDFRRQAGRGMMQLGEDIRGSRSMQARDPMEEIATIPGHLLANTLQGAGYLTQFGEDDWEGIETAAGTVAEEAMDPKYIEGGWVRPAVEAVQPYVEEPYKIAQEMSIGDVLPGAGLLAKIGMAVPMGLAAKVPAMKMGKGAAKAVKPRLPDFADEVAAAGGEIDESGVIRLFHRTTPEAAEEIRRTGQMTGKEDGVFFSTSPSNQAVGYGSEVVEVRIPLSDLELDDLFDTEAHLRLPLKRPGEMVQVEVAPEPPRRSLLARLGEGVEDPGALERGRLEGGDKVLRPGYDEDYHDKLLRQLNEASANNDTEAIQKIDAELSAIVEPVTPEIESQRISQLAALDALDPVEKARLDRAVEQGFDLDGFHGTKGDIEAFDPGLLGETTGAPSARLGYFFAADPETAQTYARMANLREINPGKQGIKNELAALDINDPNYSQKRAELKKLQKGDRLSEIESALQKEKLTLEEQMPSATKIVELQAMIKSLEKRGESSVFLKKQLEDLEELRRVIGNKARTTMLKLDSMGANIMPVKLRLQNPLEHDFKGEGYRDVSYQALLENAKNKGHDGAIFRNTTDGGGMTDIYVVFEPAQIRSRYAAFDPKDTPKTGLRQNAKLANEALQVNRKQLEVLVKSKKAVEREYSDLWAVSDIFNKKAELALAEKKSPALREDMLELSNNIKALQDRMDLLEDEARKVTIGTGDITASFAPLVLPLGGGTAAAAYLANQEQE